MKKFKVTIELVTGYYPAIDPEDDASPILKYVEFEVEAINETDAIRKAKLLETSSFSVWDSYADLI